MIFLRNMCINTLHIGDSNDDDMNINSNNNNNDSNRCRVDFGICIRSLKFVLALISKRSTLIYTSSPSQIKPFE
jgi:hypothetical protein